MTSTLREKQLLVSQLAWGARYNGIFCAEGLPVFSFIPRLEVNKVPQAGWRFGLLTSKEYSSSVHWQLP